MMVPAEHIVREMRKRARLQREFARSSVAQNAHGVATLGNIACERAAIWEEAAAYVERLAKRLEQERAKGAA